MWAYTMDATTIISPTLTNEFLYGKTMNFIPGAAPPTGSPYYAKNSTWIPLLYPNADPIGLVPNFGFGARPFAPAPPLATQPGGALSQFVLPYFNENPISNVTDNVTKVYATHTIKAGFYFETQRNSKRPMVM